MEWSKEQREAHEANYIKFRQEYLENKNRTASIGDIERNKNRCVTLVRLVNGKVNSVLKSICDQASVEFYLQEIQHFTIDCHRYMKGESLPGDIDNLPAVKQEKAVISSEELKAYDGVLKEVIGTEPYFDIEIKGISIGGDGLVAQVWYDDKRMIDLTSRLGEKVRKEVPSMDFQWEMVRGKASYRVINLTRFTGQEDKQKVLDFVDQNRDCQIESFKLDLATLFFADHYIREAKTRLLGEYRFKN